MFILLRRVERWLHQHVFKVGWLVTQNYQTTTILYYTVFLPGVLLHEVVYWLAAGIFNVRAEGDIKWPDEQEVGELKLNFVKLAPRTGTYRKAFITSAPLLVGLVCVWLIANNIFDITTVAQTMSTGEISDVGAAWQLLTGAPLFWLWVYIIFTIANTMFPTVPKDLRGWRSIALGFVVVAGALLVLGVGGEIFEALQTPISQLISVLQSTFVLILLIDVLMVSILGLIEYTIERSTGRSATFRRGKMITMTREEVLAEREKERERQQKAREREARKQAAQSVTQSIYALPFATPGSPKDTGITALESLVEDIPDEADTPFEDAVPEPSMPVFGGLANDGKPAERPLSEEEKAQRAAIAERVNLPQVPSVPKPSDYEPDTDDDNDDVDEATPAPIATPSRFGRPVSPPVTPEIDEDDDVDDEGIDVPAASTASRFGKPLSPISPTPVEADEDSDNDEAVDKPAVTTSRSGKPLSPISPTPVEADEDTDEAIEKSAVTTSRVGKPLSPISPVDTADENEDEAIAEPAVMTSRFGKPLSPTAPKPVEADEDTDDEDENIEDSPATSTPATLGDALVGVSKPAPLVSDDPPKLDDEPKEVVAVVGRPSSPGLFIEDSDDDESIDDTRRREGDDAVGSLFAQLQRSSDDDEDDESAGQAIASTKSRFSFLSGEDEDFDDEEDEDEQISARFGSGTSRFGSRFGASRFGTSRPAPKPSASSDEAEDQTDASDDDDIVYEDIEDVTLYDYEDEEDYISYDDDDEAYYVDDDD